MADKTVFDQLMEEISAQPDEYKLRSVAADWCEDSSQHELAECLRWMVRARKRPYHGTTGRATWFNADTIATGLGDTESDIPGSLYKELEGGREIANHKSYTSTREAETALHAAFAKAQAAGWRPAD